MDKEIKEQNVESRRGFLKKAVYAAPTIIALGSITRPVNAAASATYSQSGSGESNPNNAPGEDRDSAYSIFGN